MYFIVYSSLLPDAQFTPPPIHTPYLYSSPSFLRSLPLIPVIRVPRLAFRELEQSIYLTLFIWLYLYPYMSVCVRACERAPHACLFILSPVSVSMLTGVVSRSFSLCSLSFSPSQCFYLSHCFYLPHSLILYSKGIHLFWRERGLSDSLPLSLYISFPLPLSVSLCHMSAFLSLCYKL